MFVIFFVKLEPGLAEVGIQTDNGNDDLAANVEAERSLTDNDAKSPVFALKTDENGSLASGNERSLVVPDDAKTVGNEPPSSASRPNAIDTSKTGPAMVTVEVVENSNGEVIDAEMLVEADPLKRPETNTSATLGSNNKTESELAPMIKTEQGQAVAKVIGAFAFFECSAKTKIGVHDVFVAAVRAIRRENKYGQCVLI